MSVLKKHWWKALSVVLLTLVTWFTFTLPLAPGITGVHQVFEENKLVLEVDTYNADLEHVDLLCWLTSPNKKNNIHYSGATVISHNKARLYFPLPDTTSHTFYHLYMVTTKGGKLFYPDAASMKHINVLDAEYVDANPFPKKFLVPDHYASLPFQNILYESIRNLNFHVTMWMVTMILLLFSSIYSIIYLSGEKLTNDWRASVLVETAMMFTALGIITGSIWAKNTWGAYWVNDPKLNGAVVGALVYVAYLILRNSIKEDEKRARLSAVYNIFAFVIYIVFIQVLPRFTDSLHPGNGGNPAFSSYDLDSTLRMLFYPAIIGFTLVGAWVAQLKLRLKNIEYLSNNDED